MFNNNTVVTVPYGILSNKVENGVVVAHLSDLHEKEFGQDNGQLFDKGAKAVPDITSVSITRAITNDFMRNISILSIIANPEKFWAQ